MCEQTFGATAQDPWVPQSPPLSTNDHNNQGFGHLDFDPLESKEYLEGLELKLKRLQERNAQQQPSAKDMLKCLGQVKESHLKAIIDDSDSPYISIHDPDELIPQDYPALAALQRKINPEKQALTTEELKKLVENDNLGKVVHQLPTTATCGTDSEDADKDIDTASQCLE